MVEAALLFLNKVNKSEAIRPETLAVACLEAPLGVAATKEAETGTAEAEKEAEAGAAEAEAENEAEAGAAEAEAENEAEAGAAEAENEANGADVEMAAEASGADEMNETEAAGAEAEAANEALVGSGVALVDLKPETIERVFGLRATLPEAAVDVALLLTDI